MLQTYLKQQPVIDLFDMCVCIVFNFKKFFFGSTILFSHETERTRKKLEQELKMLLAYCCSCCLVVVVNVVVVVINGVVAADVVFIVVL